MVLVAILTDDRLEEILEYCIHKSTAAFPHCCPWTPVSYGELQSLVEELKANRAESFNLMMIPYVREENVKR